MISDCQRRSGLHGIRPAPFVYRRQRFRIAQTTRRLSFAAGQGRLAVRPLLWLATGFYRRIVPETRLVSPLPIGQRRPTPAARLRRHSQVVGRRSSQLQLTQLIKTALINFFCIRNLIFIVNEKSVRQRNKNTFHRNCALTERLIPGAFWAGVIANTHSLINIRVVHCTVVL